MRSRASAGTVPEEIVHAMAHSLGPVGGFAEWLAGAALHGVLGLAIGLALMPVVAHVLAPALRAVGLASSEGGH
jgi:multisubunit Na+/H+ antiporter MnhG subunit